MVVTVLADNYFGYCKKEVKTQVSFSANLSGLGEEEHAGAAVVFPSYDLGEEFDPKAILPPTPHTFKDTLMALNASEASSEGYLIDEEFPSVVFLPENATFSLREQGLPGSSREQKSLHLIPDNAVLPSLQGGNESDGE